jgi:hypothetical protein
LLHSILLYLSGLCQSGVGEGGEKGPHGPEASKGQ